MQGERRKREVISGDSKDRKQRGGETIRDRMRVNRGSSNRENGHKGKITNTPAVSTLSREGY